MQKCIRYTIASLIISSSLATPLSLSAQTAGDVQTQIQQLRSQIHNLQQQLLALQASSTSLVSSLGVRHRICLMARTLSEGETHQDVQTLQGFLREQGFFNANATGFFGPLTRDALMRWQARNAIVSEGDAATTGWGVFGPRTRSFIARWCAGVNQGDSSPGSPPAVGATSTTPGNQPPAIVSFTGPTTLTVNTAGTWTASSTDAEGDTLTYHVEWGDAASALSALTQLAELGAAQFTASTTFTHTYTRPGVFAVTLRVRDSAGGVTRATRLVRVSAAASSSPQSGGGFCTADAHQCPNGQWVGRSGPNCQFACPVPGNMGAGSGASCTFGGQTYADGQIRSEQQSCRGGSCVGEKLCYRGYWIEALEPEGQEGCPDNYTVQNGYCYPGDGADFSCWFNNRKVNHGSWVTAYENQFVAGAPFNDPCKIETRTCQYGVLTGTYGYATCTSSEHF